VSPVPETVYGAYLAAHPTAELALVSFGPTALTHAHLVEPEILVPAAYIRHLRVESTVSWEMTMLAAWEALAPMGRAEIGPAFGAQVLAAFGGNPQRAAAHPRQHVRLVLMALDGFRGRALPRHEGRGYLQLGRALSDFGGISDAVTAYDRGRDLLEQAGDGHGLRAAYARLAALMSRLGLYEQALLYAEAGQRIGRQLSGAEAGGHVAVGHAHFVNFLHDQRVRALTRIGFLDEAEAGLAAWRHDSASSRYTFDLLTATAELRIRQGRTADGLDAYLGAVDARFTNLDVGSQPGRLYYLENSAMLFGGAVGAALEVDRPDLAVGVLAAMGTDRPGRPATGPSPAWPSDALDTLDAEVMSLARSATGATVARDRTLLGVYDSRARELLETRDTVLAEHAPGDSRQWTTVADLAAAIPRAVRPGELALIYSRYDDGRVIVFAVGDGAVRCRTLRPRADEVAGLAALARTESLRRSGTDGLHELGEAVLEPVADVVADASRIYVTAHGDLADFPFHAAPFHGQPLIMTAEVRALPSLAPLRRGDDRGTPDRDGAELRAVVAAVRRPRYEVLPELLSLRAEAAAVRARFPDAIALSDDQATAAAVRAALGTADVLHLAGHAVFEPSYPQMARILLADRPLFAFEVACAARVPRLVNLSGCRAGAERRGLGGEGEGLAAAFLASGAETVIAPLWPIRDDAALAFNEALYRELAVPGAGSAQAARRAQLSLLAKPEFAHPGHWGAFAVLGTL
jgi:hypothetical protein